MFTNRFRLLLALVLTAVCCGNAAIADTAAYIVTDHTTGFALDGANIQKKLQIGSLTKIATAMVVLDWSDAHHADLGQLATVPASAAALASPQGLGLQPGEQCSLRDLLYAALLQSDNQAAETLADHVGRALGSADGSGPVTVFVAQMNALAKRLGMVRTKFFNPHGLDTLERSLPFSTAEDLAKLTAYAMNSSAFRFYVSQKERRITMLAGANREPAAYLLRNTNELLGNEGIDGVKTGTTKKAGQCVVISAARAPESREEGGKVFITPRRLNVVVLGSTDRFNAASQYLARGWQLYESWAAAGRPTKGWKPGR